MKFFEILILTILIVSSSQFVRNETRSKGRIHGQDAVNGQIPYAVLMEIFYTHYYLECTGSLIGPEWILSSAKCVHGMDFAILYLGSVLRRVAEVAYTVYSTELIFHPSWDIRFGVHDIVLISIPKTDICYNIFPVPLPVMISEQVTYEGDTAIASGWNTISQTLQWVQVTIMTTQECATAYTYAFIDDVICTNAEFYQCYSRNFGGPLVSENYGTLIGFLSNTVRHNGSCVMIYTPISSYLEWIKDVTGIAY